MIFEAISKYCKDVGVCISSSIVQSINLTSADLYIIFTTHQDHELPKYYISYNMEQLTTHKVWDTSFFQRLKGAVDVWDYSALNIKILRRHRIFGRHVPVGYSDSLVFNSLPNFNVDAIFIGAINEARNKTLQHISSLLKLNGMNMTVCGNCWGVDAFAGKIGVNMHFYSGITILEVNRIVPWIANNVIVVSTPGNDTWYRSRLAESVTFSSNEHLPAHVLKLAALSRQDAVIVARNRADAMRKNLCFYSHFKDSGALKVLSRNT